jgi:hypothetical protein
MEILRYEQFNESWWQKIKSGAKKLLRSSDSPFKTEYSKELALYDLSTVVGDDNQSLKIYHSGGVLGKLGLNKKVVAEIMLNSSTKLNMPLWDLFVYYYESEIPQTKKLKVPQEFPGQKEQPYGRAKETFPFNSEGAMKEFLEWWKNKTKSGRAKNPFYKVKY